jgi:S-layer homology domain
MGIGGPPNDEMLHVQVGGQLFTFRDVPISAWFAPSISALIQAGIASGYRDSNGNPLGFFGPEANITEAEALKMILLVAQKPIDPSAFPKNPSAQDDWSAPYVRVAEDLNLSLYTPDLDVHQPARRGEVVETLLEVLGIPTTDTGDNPFSDLPIDHPHTAAILTAWRLGIITGDTDAQGHPIGTVRPDAPVNRAEAAKIIALAGKMLGNE